MRSLQVTSQFKKDYKRAKKRGLNMKLLQAVLEQLLADQPLDPKHRDHPLIGDYIQYRECHIQPDWLLIYRKTADTLLLIAHRTGAHADLFDE